MIKDKPRNAKYGKVFEDIIKTSYEKMMRGEDDFFIMCVGTRGTGKSHLSLHAYHNILYPDQASVENIGLNKEDFSQGLKNATEGQNGRFVCNDEANVSKRDHAKTWNKDLLDLYYSIRGLQLFHWWNNPSLDIIDKPFIKEIIKGVVFIANKATDKPRTIFYFTKDDILELFDKKGELSLDILNKQASKYAYLQSWFKPYEGSLLNAYLEKKHGRMEQKVYDFFEKYGQPAVSLREAGRQMGTTHATVKKYYDKLKEEDKVSVGEDSIETVTGQVKLTQSGLEKVRDRIKEANNAMDVDVEVSARV